MQLEAIALKVLHDKATFWSLCLLFFGQRVAKNCETTARFPKMTKLPPEGMAGLGKVRTSSAWAAAILGARPNSDPRKMKQATKLTKERYGILITLA